MGVNGFKMLVSFLLVFIFMIVYKVPITWNVLWFIPILITVLIVTFGVCLFALHIGVFAEDMTNLTNIALRLLFYLSGIFYNIDTINNAVYRSILLDLNPIANLIYNMRSVLMYCSGPVGMWTLLWFFIGLGLCALGINTVYKYENTYVKVMR